TQEAPQVGNRVETIGGAIGMTLRKPMLQERSRGRQQDIGNAHREAEQTNDPGDGTGFRAIGLPLIRGRDRKKEAGQQEQGEVDDGLRGASGPQPGDEAMRVGVAGEQSTLEKEQAGGPDAGAPSVPGEDVARHHGLDLEEEKGTEEDSGEKERHEAMEFGSLLYPGQGILARGKMRHPRALGSRTGEGW